MFEFKIFKKTRKLLRNDKFVTNKTKICLFCQFYVFFYEIKTKLSEMRLKKDRAQKKMKKSQIGRQHFTKLFNSKHSS